MKKALIRNSDNVVVNVINVDTSIPAPKEGEPDKRYSPPSGYRLVDIKPGARAGNIYSDGKFSESQAQKDKKTAEEAEKRAALPAVVNEERERRIAEDITVTASPGKSFPVQVRDERDVRNILSLVVGAVIQKMATDTTTITFRDASNTDQTLNPDEVIAMGVAVKTAIDTIYKKSWAIKARSDLATIDIGSDKIWE